MYQKYNYTPTLAEYNQLKDLVSSGFSVQEAWDIFMVTKNTCGKQVKQEQGLIIKRIESILNLIVKGG